MKLKLFAAVGLLILVSRRPVTATLGGDEASVGTDRAQMRAAQRVVRNERYILYELRTSSGTVVREFVSSAGTVFGVAWQGPVDVRQILGSYFDSYTALRAGRWGRADQAPLSIFTPDLWARSTSPTHRARVYVPTLVPRGVDAASIR
jgi:hypothetical protein